VIVTDWGEKTSLVYESPTITVIVMPGATADWVAHVVQRGLAHAAASGVAAVELEVDRADDVMRGVTVGHGFALKGDGVVECWLNADTRPDISPLHDDYRLFARDDLMDRPHHLSDERRPDLEQRLRQLSLYRPDLDLVVFDRDDNPAAHALSWYDPVTSTGVVEPVRTYDDHRRHGLSRHILTTGIDRLAKVGARRISIGFEPGNPASSSLYLSLGFQPHRQTDMYSGPTRPPTGWLSARAGSRVLDELDLVAVGIGHRRQRPAP
jgi:GNAT superfamily N-acetyltransferase